MIISAIALRGLTRFSSADPVRVDLAELGPGLVAFVGRNGSGKTTLLEAVPAALWGTFPSRKKGKSLYDYANARDAFIEIEVVNGAERYRIRRLIDATARKMEALIITADGALNDGKVSTFDPLILERFGSERLFLASIFAAQNQRGNILELERSERKRLFAELLQIDRFDGLRARAQARAEAEARALDIDTAKRQDLEKIIAFKADAGTCQRQTETDLTEASQELAQARKNLGTLEDRVKAESSSRAARADLARDLANLSRALGLAQEQVGEHRKRIALEKARIAGAEAEAREAMDRADGDRLEAARRLIEEEAEIAKIRKTAETVLEAEPEISKAADDLPMLEADLDDATRRLADRREAEGAASRLKADLEDLERQRTVLKRRLELRDRVPCAKAAGWYADADAETLSGELVDLAGDCPLLQDARDADADLGELNGRIDTATAEAAALGDKLEKAALGAARDALRVSELTRDLPGIRETAALKINLEAARGRLLELGDRLQICRRRRDQDVQRADTDQKIAEAAVQGRTEDLEALALDPLAAPLQAAVKKAEGDLVACRQAADELRQGALDTVDPEALDGARKAIALGESRQGDLLEARGRHRARIAEISRAERDLESLPEGRETHLADWRILEQGFGPDGIPNLLIDAAAPEISAVANRLLETCWSGRFRVEFRTLKKLKRKVAGQAATKEDFSILVFDDGEEREVEDLSGGERAVLGEALGLACAIFNGWRSGIHWKTLFRDETAGALDPESAREYPGMLRKALEVGGFDQVVFIAHAPEVFEAADVQVRFADGKVSVRGGGDG